MHIVIAWYNRIKQDGEYIRQHTAPTTKLYTAKAIKLRTFDLKITIHWLFCSILAISFLLSICTCMPKLMVRWTMVSELQQNIEILDVWPRKWRPVPSTVYMKFDCRTSIDDLQTPAKKMTLLSLRSFGVIVKWVTFREFDLEDVGQEHCRFVKVRRLYVCCRPANACQYSRF